MTKFKIGDLVRCVNDKDLKYSCDSLIKGAIYTVIDVGLTYDKSYWVELRFQNKRLSGSYDIKRFELAENVVEFKPKVINVDFVNKRRLR